MLKVKDGYAKVIGTTVNGSSDYLLLSNGGEQKLSDLAPFNATRFYYNDTTNLWHCILQFTTNWVGSVTFMYSPEECQRDYWCLGNLNIRSGDIKFYIVNFSNDFTSLFKATVKEGTSSNTYVVKLWVKNSNALPYNPYGLIQVLAYHNATITKVGDVESQASDPGGTTPTNNLLADTVDGIHADRFAYIYNSDNYKDGITDDTLRSPNTMITDSHSNAQMGLVYGSTGNPTGTNKWVHIWQQKWNHNSDSKSWISQIAIDPTNPTMWYRTSNTDITNATWQTVLDSSNFKNYFKAGSNISLNSTNNIITISATNTWRNILVKGNSIGSANLNLKAGSNISLTQSGGDVTISGTNTWREIKGAGTSIGSNPLNITGDGVNIVPNTGTGEIKIQLTGNIITHTHTTLAATSNVAINATTYGTGLCFKPYGSGNGGPTTYGNILEYVSSAKGGGQLAMEWSGSQTLTNGSDTNVGRLYYRSKRDIIGGWTAWKVVAWTSDIPTELKNPKSLTIKTNGTSLGSYDGSTDTTMTITYNDVGAAASNHNHTSLSNVEKISFKSDTSDACYIATTISSSATYLDFYLADDASQEKFRWIFKDCNSSVGEKTIMELSPTNRAATALKLYDNYVAIYGSGQGESGLMYRNGGYIGVSTTANVTTATASNTPVYGDFYVLCMRTKSVYDTATSKATQSYDFYLKNEFPKATVATKLSSSEGSLTAPIYFSDGKPTVCSYSLNATVPANAIFTDTTYDLTIGSKNASSSTTSCTNGNVYLNLLKNSSGNKWCLLKGTNATTVTYDGNGTITINSNNTWRDITVKGTSIGTNTLQLIAGTGINLSVDTGKVTIANTVSQIVVNNTYNDSSKQSESIALSQKGAYNLYLNSFNCKRTGANSGDASSDTMGSVTWSSALPSSLTSSGWSPYNYGEVLSFPAGNIRFDIYASHLSSSTGTNNGLYYRTGYYNSSKTDYKNWVKIIDSNTIKSYFNNSWNYDKPSMPTNLLPYINDKGVTSIGGILNFFTGGSSPSYTQLVAQTGSSESNTLTLPKATGTLALTNQISNAQVCRMYYICASEGSSPAIIEGTGNQTDVSPSLTTTTQQDQHLSFDTKISYEDEYHKKYFLIVSPSYDSGAGTGQYYNTNIRANLNEMSHSTLQVDVYFDYMGDSNFVCLTIAIFQINELN